VEDLSVRHLVREVGDLVRAAEDFGRSVMDEESFVSAGVVLHKSDPYIMVGHRRGER
jgi:hypothetical protein